MSTLDSITDLLKNIHANIAILIKEEIKLTKQIELLSQENDNLRTYLNTEQESPPEAVLLELPSLQQQQQLQLQLQQPLLAITETCSYVIKRNMILLSNRKELSILYRKLNKLVHKISIKQYIMRCSRDGIKDCYDVIDNRLRFILDIQSKQERQITIFQKGYLLYDLVRDNTKVQFINMLKDPRKTYNTVIHEPQPQSGGAPSTLLQVIGQTKIKAIIQFMNDNNSSDLNISDVTNANTLRDKEDIINAIAYFFYEQPFMNIHL
jgi:hypothetical protein